MNVMVLGPAGCGKTSLTGRFGAYLREEGYIVKLVNLDPGCLSLPYRCDYDLRDRFTIEKIMRDEGLGPSGSMVEAMNRLTRVEVPKLEGDFVLIDTPGQLEVFAFYDSGPKVVERLQDLVGVFIIDAGIGVEDLPAAYLYSLAIRYRLGIEMVNVINKVDLIEKRNLDKLKAYLTNPAGLGKDMKGKGVLSDIYFPVSEMLQRVVPAQRIPALSAKTGEGLGELLDLLREVKCACGDLT
ncbi:MAG: ATP/GTP-binding protein [Candidatus Bathyarchaeia archaeon]